MSNQILDNICCLEMHDLILRFHYSIHTERAYCDWVARFVRFHHMKARDALFVDAEKKVQGGEATILMWTSPVSTSETDLFRFNRIYNRR